MGSPVLVVRQRGPAGPFHCADRPSDQLHSEGGRVATEGIRAYLFDRLTRPGTASVIEMNTRVAACYTWAERHGVEIIDEVIAWGDPGCRPGEVLADVVGACMTDGAALLVHSAEVIGPFLGTAPGLLGPDAPDVLVVTGPPPPPR